MQEATQGGRDIAKKRQGRGEWVLQRREETGVAKKRKKKERQTRGRRKKDKKERRGSRTGKEEDKRQWTREKRKKNIRIISFLGLLTPGKR